MKIQKHTLIFAALVVFLGGLFILKLILPSTIQPNGDVLRNQESTWQKNITQNGAAFAYAQLKEDMRGKNPSIQHAAAHAFGGALFAVNGLAGFSTCDSDFGYGCFHQFLGSAVNTLGVDVLPDLNKACLASNQTNACQHGIGHGLVAYLGYTEADLVKASALCGNLQDSSYIDGCTGGAFMEYNLRTMLGTGARPVQDEDLTSLCKKYAGLDAESCALYLPQWWWVVLPHTDPKAVFVRMGRLCDSLDTSLTRLCYEGVGQMAPPAAAYSAVASIPLCDSSSSNTNNQLFCRTYAANVFLGSSLPNEAKKVCAGLEGAREVYCMAYATGAASLQHELPAP